METAHATTKASEISCNRSFTYLNMKKNTVWGGGGGGGGGDRKKILEQINYQVHQMSLQLKLILVLTVQAPLGPTEHNDFSH